MHVNNSLSLSLVAIWLVVLGCQPAKDKASVKSSLGKVDGRLREVSGLAASIANPGMLWAINDSGNPAEVFLIDEQAQTKMICKLVNGVNRDWEDIAIGAGPDSTRNYVYVADIGDNWGHHEFKYIYRFAEPTLTTQKEIDIDQFEKFVLKMPDGARDAETILIDPNDHNFYLISKREDSVGLYLAAYPFAKDTVELQKISTLPFSKIVAGSITRDGTEVLLKDYDRIYYWKRTAHEKLSDVLKRKSEWLPYERERQGEAITWSNSGDKFFTLSEGTIWTSSELFAYKFKR